MKLHELRSVRAVIASGFRVTVAADAVHGSQPGISRHLQSVEAELGVELFERRKNRLIGLTPAGRTLVPIIDQALDQLDGLHRVAGQFARGELGRLTVATSHTHARYLLPAVIEAFIREYPAVRLKLQQGHVGQITRWLATGEADISVSAAPSQPPASLLYRPFRQMHRIVLTPSDHPLHKIRGPTLRDLTRYPIITYDSEYSAYTQIMQSFEAAGLAPNLALSTSDTDTMKTYTLCGLGIAIMADSAFEPKRDEGLCAIDARHLFPSSVINIGINKERPLNQHALRFLEMLDPSCRAGGKVATSGKKSPSVRALPQERRRGSTPGRR